MRSALGKPQRKGHKRDARGWRPATCGYSPLRGARCRRLSDSSNARSILMLSLSRLTVNVHERVPLPPSEPR